MTFLESRAWVRHNSNIVFFVGGFLFDALTLTRIDNVLDLLLQTFYLAAITLILVLQVAVQQGRWAPSGRWARLWEYNTEAIHFFYGGLLSAYIIFYFKSASASRSMFFLFLVAALMLANEMPQVKRAGEKLRIGLHAFCIASFLNYLIPVVVGRMGVWTFMLSIGLSAVALFFLVRGLGRWYPEPRRAWLSLGWPPALVLVILMGVYSLKWIPPVPLSLKYIGIYHKVERENVNYRLLYPRPPWYTFWKKESRPFLARPEDAVHCFVRIFAPRRFTHQIFIRWSLKDPLTGRWLITDRIPLPVRGGRGEGYRGFVAKSRHQPGLWRVEAVTEDDRVIGAVVFTLRPDGSAEERTWRERRM